MILIKDILGDFDCDIEERRVSSLTLHLKMAETTATTEPQEQPKATESLLEIVTKQVAPKDKKCLWSDVPRLEGAEVNEETKRLQAGLKLAASSKTPVLALLKLAFWFKKSRTFRFRGHITKMVGPYFDLEFA